MIKKFNLNVFNKQIILFVVLLIVAIAIVGVSANIVGDFIVGDFNNGTYNNTFYNSSGFVQLTSGNTSGSFVSRVFDVGSLAKWNNISWLTNGIGELPDDQRVENFSGGANMTGNVLLMHLDEKSGNAIDSSGEGNNGVASSGVTYNVPGKFKTALSFDGTSSSYVNVPNSNTLNPGSSDFTIEGWFKLSYYGSTNGQILYNKENLYELSAGGGYVTYAWRPHWAWDGGTSFPISVGKWYYVTLVYDHSKQYLYKDGKLVYSRAQTGDIGTNSNRFALATRGTSGGGRSPFHGSIDEFAIYKRALSPHEILDHYKRGIEKLNLSVRSCDDASCSGNSWENLGADLTSPQNISLSNNTYFQYKFDFLTDDSSYSPELYNFSIDYTLLDVKAPQLTLNNPSNNTNISSQNILFNFTQIEDYPAPVSCSFYLDGILNQTNSSVVNDTLTNFNIFGISEGEHNWNIDCTDGAGNTNVSEIRNFSVDVSPPTLNSLTYSPNSPDDVDPNTNLTFSANVSDNLAGVSSVILEYYNGTTWANVTMTTSGNNIYNATIKTVSSEQNYTFNIWSNDSFGNSEASSNQTFSSSWDCSWHLSPSALEETMGFYEDKPVGNITIINTGDSNYTNNNCSVVFSSSYNGFDSNYWSSSSWRSNNRGFQMPNSITVNASSNKTFQVNASFPSTSSPFTESPTITLTASINNSVSGNQTGTVSSTLIISPPNPLLYQEVTDYPTTYVYLTPGSFSLSAYLRNLGGDNSERNTAYNVSLNWTLPSSLSSRIASGNQTVFYTNLTNNSKQENTLIINFTKENIKSMDKGTLNVTLYSHGYKNNSEPIINSGNTTVLNNTIRIQFLCYDVKDGYCVSSCGVGVDPDCSASHTNSVKSGGSGGGGGAGDSTKYEKSDAYFELLHGDVQTFELPIDNKWSSTKEDLKISVRGINPKYIKFNPVIDEIKPYSSKNLTIQINAPAYFTRGKFRLIFDISGKLVSNKTIEFSETKIVTLYIIDVLRKDATGMLNQSYNMVNKMNSSGLVLEQASQLLHVMSNSYNEVNFKNVKENYLVLKNIYNSAMGCIEADKELKAGIAEAKRNGIEVLETKKILFLAEVEFKRGDYVSAFKKYTSAKLTYALETKGKFSIYHTIKNNPKKSLLSFMGFLLFSFGSSFAVKHGFYKRKLKLLDEEEKLLLQLMKVVQLETFENNKMSMEEYEEAMRQYETKLSETVEEKISVETKLSNLLKINGKKKALKQEKERLIGLIRELQDRYLNKGNIETRIYENMLKSYTEKISDVEGKLTFIEAKEAIRKFRFSRGKNVSLDNLTGEAK